MQDNRTNGKFKMPMLRFARASLVGTFLTPSPKNNSLSALPLLAAVLAMALLFAAMANSVPAEAQSLTDYDADNDGLIEVSSLAQLDAIRYDLDGDGSPTNSTAYDAAFPSAQSGMGCPSTGCIGYELTANLDFDTNGDGRTDIAGDDYWNDGAGWDPIGTSTAIFEGNDNIISGLFIRRSYWVGLFDTVASTGTIRNVSLTGVDVTGDEWVGGLVGENRGTITASYATGTVSGEDYVGGLVGENGGTITASYATETVSGEDYVGGLVGENGGTITASYATGTVSGEDHVGGLVGLNAGIITSSYATGTVSGDLDVGGLVGRNNWWGGTAGGTYILGGTGTITSSYATGTVSGPSQYVGGLVGGSYNGAGITTSYWDTETSRQSTSDGGVGKTTSELQSPTGYSGIYADWNVDLDGDGTGDDPWDFGTSSEYPVIDYDPSATDTPTTPGAPTIGTVTPGSGTLAITWTAPSSDGGSAITAYDLRYIATTADKTVDSNWTVVDDVWTLTHATLQYTLAGLTAGTQYDLQVRAVNAAGDGPWSATATGMPTAAAATSASDYDADDDGLIEVGSLAQLDAIRYDLDGDGSPTNSTAYDAAFPNAATGMGCPSTGCTGYELTTNLDFDTNGDGRTDIAGDIFWNGGGGWDPIGTFNISGSFTATFEGNGNSISGLFINRPTADFVGLFGGVGILGTGTIRNVGVTGVDVTGSRIVGGLVGWSRGTISACYATGAVSGSGEQAGGLAGYNGGTGTVTASFADVTVSGSRNVGGLVGHNEGTGSITASYSTGDVSGTGDFVGGLVGVNFSTIRASYATGTASGRSNAGGLAGSSRGTTSYSYWDTETSGLSTSAGGEGKTTSELQSPTSNTGIYATWDSNVWDFGTASQYPALKGLGLSVAEQRQSHPAGASAGTGLTDRDILVALYNATDGDNWTDNTNWLGDEPLGDWHGVTTDADGQVTGLSLGRNNLTGAIPSQLGSLSDLETLWLGDNQLTGAIPAELGSLSNLDYLGLESNALTGAIPTELGNLSSLTWLALNGNQLTGALPQSFTSLSALDDFAFSDNSGLCAPTDAAFQAWLQGISNSNMSIEVAVPFGPNCDDSQPTPTTDPCVQPLPDDGTANGSWASDCPSTNNSGSYARYYTFTLTEQSDVVVTLESSEDTYLFLLDGHGTNGRKLHENDDHITGSGCTATSNFDSCIAETLEPGNYTIEATTLDPATTGDFTLTLEISAASQQPTPPPPPGPQPTPAPGVVVSAGPNHACALDTNGEIACQGVNDFNQVSDRPTSSGFVAVSVGDKHSCAIDASGSVECWGSNEHGQSSAPSRGTFLAIGAGDNYTCALRSDNNLECWGRFEAVESGAPTPPPPPPPTTPGPTPAPDLAVDAPTVSDSSPTAGASFTLNATVRNRGDGAAASTTLRYFQSTDSSITTSDTEVGTASVNGLSASGSSSDTISLTAPSTAGTYYYGACVDSVSGESDTGNNCSTAVAVTVSAAPQPTDGPFTVAITTCSGTRGFASVDVEMGGTVTATRDVSVTSLTVTGTANGSTVDTVSMNSGRWQAGETQDWSMSGTVLTTSSTLSCEATLRGSIQSGSGTTISSSTSAATEQQITD